MELFDVRIRNALSLSAAVNYLIILEFFAGITSINHEPCIPGK
jgi:hypothetical protein